MPTIIALLFASILIFFPGHAIAAGGTSQYKPQLSFTNDNLTGKDFSGKNLQTAEFTTCKLDSTNFAGADLTGVVISSAILKSTNFHGANVTQGLLDQVRFVDADLSDAVFVEAMMLRSTFKNVNIAGADFTSAILGKVEQAALCKMLLVSILKQVYPPATRLSVSRYLLVFSEDGVTPNPPYKADARTVLVPRQCSAPSRGAFRLPPLYKGQGGFIHRKKITRLLYLAINRP
jgi:Pentapeptide repeats (9 copies)